MKNIKKTSSIFLILILSLGLCFSLTSCEVNNKTNSDNIKISLSSSQSVRNLDGTSCVRLSVISDYITDDSYKWEVDWYNPDSAWSKNKLVTDFIEVNVIDDYSSTVDILCKQAFGEKIVVTCYLESNLLVSASCVCDYSGRLLDFDLTKMGISEIREVNGKKRVISKLGFADVSDTDITYNVNYSDYTVLTDSSEFFLYIRLTDEFITVLDNLYGDTQLDTGVGDLISGNDINVKPIQYTGDLVLNAVTTMQMSLIKTYYELIADGKSVPSTMVPTSYLKKLSEFGSEKTVGHIVVARRTYNGVSTNYEIYCQYPIYLDESVTNLAL